jgi:transglutaminase-like putative cysteine protease
MKLDVTYRTLLRYSELVVESQNEVRARPADTPAQIVHSYEVVVSPHVEVFSFIDAWGTAVDTFGVRPPHHEMEVVATSSVTTAIPIAPSIVELAALTDDAFGSAHHEYLQPGRHTRWGEPIASAARGCVEQSSHVADLANRLLAMTHERLTYTPGATAVGVEVEEVFAGRVGVCQDYAHLMVAACRSVGLPARYVSGYLFTTSDSDGGAPTDGQVNVQTHAWVEVAVPQHGWWPLDPTNARQVGERHVKIGHGRDYDDVMPFRGVYIGDATSEVDVDVTIARNERFGDARASVMGIRDEARVRMSQAAAVHLHREQQQQQQQQQ